MAYYPIFVEMKDRACLVIGGGRVAEGKIEGLLAAEADVTVVAPDLTPVLKQLLENGRFKYEARPYLEGDLQGYEVCFVATDDGAVNAEVATEGKRKGIWVNAADDPIYCDFILPSLVRRGQVVIAASTGGSSPALARKLREELTDLIGPEYGPMADLLNEVRQELRTKGIAVDAEVWNRALNSQLKKLLAAGMIEEARTYLVKALGVQHQLQKVKP